MAGDGIPEFINIDGSKADGVELEWALQRGIGGVTASANYAYVDHRVVTNISTSQQFQPGQPLLRRPRHAGSLRASFVRGRLTLNGDVRIVGDRHDHSFLSLRTVPNAAMPAAITTDITVNPGYTVFGAGADVAAHERLSMFLRVNNLGDAEYENVLGYPALPRAFVAGARVRFGGPLTTDFDGTIGARAMRRVLFQVHLWVGLIAGVYVLVISVTGAALVFRIDLQRAMHPHLFTPRTAGALADPVTIMESVSRAYPGHNLSGVDAPTTARPTYLAYVTTPGQFATVLIDPVSAEVLGELPENSMVRTLQDLHYDLLAGRTGRTVNGVGAAAVLVMGITGVVHLVARTKDVAPCADDRLHATRPLAAGGRCIAPSASGAWC